PLAGAVPPVVGSAAGPLRNRPRRETEGAPIHQKGALEMNEQVVIERTYRAQLQELWDLWTTKEGFESWWGPEGFRVEGRKSEARKGGAIHYARIADAPEQIEFMKRMGRPTSHETRGKFSEFAPHTRLALTHMIDFIPGVAAYESTMAVDFIPAGD